MTNRRLYNDDARCLGVRCDMKHECLRYLQRHQGGERTPMYNNACYNVGDAFIKREDESMSELQQLEQRLSTVIISQCNTFGCRDCDMRWEGGCSATDLQNQIMELVMQEHNTASHKDGRK